MNRPGDMDDFEEQEAYEELEKLTMVDERSVTWPAGEKLEMKNSFSLLAMILGSEEMKETYLARENFYAHYVGYLKPNESLAIVKKDYDYDSGKNDSEE